MLKIGNFQIPTAWIDSYNGLLCVILGPIMAAIWMKKSKSKKGDFGYVYGKDGLYFIDLNFQIRFR